MVRKWCFCGAPLVQLPHFPLQDQALEWCFSGALLVHKWCGRGSARYQVIVELFGDLRPGFARRIAAISALQKIHPRRRERRPQSPGGRPRGVPAKASSEYERCPHPRSSRHGRDQIQKGDLAPGDLYDFADGAERGIAPPSHHVVYLLAAQPNSLGEVSLGQALAFQEFCYRMHGQVILYLPSQRKRLKSDLQFAEEAGTM